jgi:hypothetical protein
MEDKYRGHPIELIGGDWFYCDTKELVSSDKNIACGHCGKENTKDGHDGCLDTLPYVINACCGHGADREAYVQFKNGYCVRGKFAKIVVKLLRRKYA